MIIGIILLVYLLFTTTNKNKEFYGNYDSYLKNHTSGPKCCKKGKRIKKDQKIILRLTWRQ